MNPISRKVFISNADNRDWEDLAAFELADQPYLMVADIGDNQAKRSQVTLYCVPEPTQLPPDQSTSDEPWRVPYTKRLDFHYPDGPRDAEGIAVDQAQQQLLVLNKRTKPLMLYSIALADLVSTATDQPMIAAVCAEFTLPEMPAELRAKKGFHAMSAHLPTALDIFEASPQRPQQLLITNYTQALIYRRQPDESWATALQHAPQELAVPVLKQTEAACFKPDGSAIYITSEKVPAPLVEIAIPWPHSRP